MNKALDVLRDYVKENGLKGTSTGRGASVFGSAPAGIWVRMRFFEALRPPTPRSAAPRFFGTLKLLEECGLASR